MKPLLTLNFRGNKIPKEKVRIPLSAMKPLRNSADIAVYRNVHAKFYAKCYAKFYAKK